MRPTPFKNTQRLVRVGEDPYPDHDAWPLLVGLESAAHIQEQFAIEPRDYTAVASKIRIDSTRIDLHHRLVSYDFWGNRHLSMRERVKACGASTSVLYRLYQTARLATVYLSPIRHAAPETVTGIELCDMVGLTQYVPDAVASAYLGVRVDALAEARENFGVRVKNNQHYWFADMLPLLGSVSHESLLYLYEDVDRGLIDGLRNVVCVPSMLKRMDLAKLTAQQWLAAPDMSLQTVANHRRWPLRFVELLYKKRRGCATLES